MSSSAIKDQACTQPSVFRRGFSSCLHSKACQWVSLVVGIVFFIGAVLSLLVLGSSYGWWGFKGALGSSLGTTMRGVCGVIGGGLLFGGVGFIGLSVVLFAQPQSKKKAEGSQSKRGFGEVLLQKLYQTDLWQNINQDGLQEDLLVARCEATDYEEFLEKNGGRCDVDNNKNLLIPRIAEKERLRAVSGQMYDSDRKSYTEVSYDKLSSQCSYKRLIIKGASGKMWLSCEYCITSCRFDISQPVQKLCEEAGYVKKDYDPPPTLSFAKNSEVG